MTKDEQKINPK